MLFMSEEHVAAMNELLDASAEVRASCSRLPQPRVMTYVLADGPDGRTVHWSMSFDLTVRFSLGPAAQPDVVFRGDWCQMMRAAAASRCGQAVDPCLTVEGDADVIEQVQRLAELARSVATLDVEFPFALGATEKEP